MNRNRIRNIMLAQLFLLTAVSFTLLGTASAATTQGGEEGAKSLTMEVQTHLERSREILDSIIAVEGDRTVDNTLALMNELSIELDAAGAISSLMENVHPDPVVREAAEKGSQDVSAFVTQLSLNRDLYDAIAAVDVSSADAVTKRLYAKTIRDYKRAGVDKDEATRKQIQALRDELVEIGQNFDRNIRESVRHIYVDSADDLAGLPQDYIDAHQPDETGKIKITTQYPDYLPFLDYAQNGAAREKLYMEFKNRAFPENREVLMQLITKRHELANILGYPTWADYITEDKMAKSAENVAKFVEQLDRAAKERAQRDYEMLLARKQKDDPKATAVQDWEKSYYGELVKNEEFNFDSQELRNYYNYHEVKRGILDMTAEMFGVTYKAIPDAEVWEETVECYEIYEDGKLLGRFWLDMHPRDGKYGHAAAFTMRTGVEGIQIPESVLVCNFPGGNGEGPHLMDHDQVETFLHEFGHLLHSQFGGHQKWIDLSGIATEWDFVEAPSQMLEEWSLDAKTLQKFAHHHKTGEPVPEELVERLRIARDFGNGTYVTQQNYYTAISLNIYNRDPSEVDLDKLVPELERKYGSFDVVEGTHHYANFGHLEGYSAMYYTYMWSLVISKDLFSKFDRSNLMDAGIAMDYRKKILDPGGIKDASDLIESFLGRPYSFESFREWLNRGAS